MAAASGRGAVAAAEEEDFSERELEVAAILLDLPSIVRAERRRHRRLERQQQARPEIPTWGRRRPRKAPAVSPTKNPAAAIVAAPAAPGEDDDRHSTRDGAASPDTPLAFPADDHDHEEDDYEDRKKAAAHDEWVHHQRGAVASLSHENAHLVKQIEEFRARLETSRSTHDSLSLMHQSKHKKRNRPEEEEEERRWKLRACAERPALDLNEPAEADAEDAKPQALAAQQQWCHRGYQLQQLVQQKAAATAAARRRRREIRRAKASAGSSRTRRLG